MTHFFFSFQLEILVFFFFSLNQSVAIFYLFPCLILFLFTLFCFALKKRRSLQCLFILESIN